MSTAKKKSACRWWLPGGTALGVAALNAAGQTLLWARNAGLLNSINTDHENPELFCQTSICWGLRATAALEDLEEL